MKANMIVTSETAINEHFDEALKRTGLSMNKAAAIEEVERQRTECLEVFRRCGELRVYKTGAQWEIIKENKMLTIRKRSGLSQAKFGEKYGIPKRTIESWEMGERECPVYVMSLLDRVVNEDFGQK